MRLVPCAGLHPRGQRMESDCSLPDWNALRRLSSVNTIQEDTMNTDQEREEKVIIKKKSIWTVLLKMSSPYPKQSCFVLAF